MGVTKTWERIFPDGTINPGPMTSFSHNSLGAVVNRLHETIEGVKSLEPGRETIDIKPTPSSDIANTKGAFEEPYG